MFYVGDLSIQDVNVLCQLSRHAKSILEFGVGASTQVFAQTCSGKILSVETDARWIDRTRAILDLMKIGQNVTFVPYDVWRVSPQIDLIFNDGVDHLRMAFAEAAWPYLQIGGCLVFHDTRRQHDFNNATAFCQRHFTEISNIAVNDRSSNLTIVTKKLAEPYVNWNITENRSPVAAGYASFDETLIYVRACLAR